jgi:hypothetical protein
MKNNPYQFLKNFSEILDLKVNLDKIDYAPKNTRLRKYLCKLLIASNYFSSGKTSFKYSLFNLPFVFTCINQKVSIYNQFRIFGKPKTNFEVIGKKDFEFIHNYYSESNQALLKMGITAIKDYNYPL